MNKDLSPYAWYIEKDMTADLNKEWSETDNRCCVLKKI